ncbi:hypothetical protein HYX13_01535 [Candidatus Woesearchaeota archaeon]|nr:hypothetical protein [Candidatus Woesearchaeota archaeon]
MNHHSELEKLVHLKRLREKEQEEKRSREEQSQEQSFQTQTTTSTASQDSPHHSLYPLLQQGQTISPESHSPYTIQQLLYQAPERQTYLARHQGEEVTLKVVTLLNRSAVEEVQRLQERLTQVNAVLDRECKVFALNSLQYAVASTYLPGDDLKQVIEKRKKAFTEEETIDFLVQMLEGDLGTLHGKNSVKGDGWTHGDIKPRNIVLTTGKNESGENETEKKYSLIDFGNIHRDNAERTLTLRDLEGSWNYRKSWKSTYEKEDDYFSLARVGYFLLTGNDPALLLSGTDSMQQRVDKEQFRALPVRKELQDILLRMQGYGKQYHGIEGMVEELKGLGKEKIEQDLKVGLNEEIHCGIEKFAIIASIGTLIGAGVFLVTALLSSSEQNTSIYSQPPAQIETVREKSSPPCFITTGRGQTSRSNLDANCDGIIDNSFEEKIKGVEGTVKDFWMTEGEIHINNDVFSVSGPSEYIILPEEGRCEKNDDTCDSRVDYYAPNGPNGLGGKGYSYPY